MKNALISLGVALALLLGSSGVSAQNLVVNGGFEANGGDFTFPDNWIEGGGNNNTFASSPGLVGLNPHSGGWFLALGSVAGDTTASQTITTTLGATYHLQFFYTTDGGTPSDLNVTWDGLPVYSEVGDGTPHDWFQYDFLVIGTGSDTLSFGARNDPTWSGLDDVSLFAVGVPEPATLGLLAGGSILSAGYVYWRRRAKLRQLDATVNA